MRLQDMTHYPPIHRLPLCMGGLIRHAILEERIKVAISASNLHLNTTPVALVQLLLHQSWYQFELFGRWYINLYSTRIKGIDKECTD